MDREQGEFLAGLASTPRLGVLWWKRETFDWWGHYPDKIHSRVKGSYVNALIAEGNISRMAKTLRQDKEEIERWLEKYEEYKGRYPSPVKGT